MAGKTDTKKSEGLKKFPRIKGDPKEAQVRSAIHVLWRNHPEFPSTFSKCPVEGCEEMARGMEVCSECAEKELADLVSPEVAKELHDSIKAYGAIRAQTHEYY